LFLSSILWPIIFFVTRSAEKHVCGVRKGEEQVNNRCVRMPLP
jgi:hypothetical protein